MEEYVNEKTAIATDWIRKDDLTYKEWEDIYTLWEYAIKQSEFEFEDVSYWEDEMIELYLDLHFGFKVHNCSVYDYWDDIDRMVEAAFEEGLEQMLEAYCEGVPIEDILA